MEIETRTVDYWRKYFRGADSSIFDVIESAILVAATDYPSEFRKRRDRMAEMLFSSKCARCNVEVHTVSNCSYDEAEALTEEMVEEEQIHGEILRIKKVLSDGKDQSEAELLESLRRLQLMSLSVDTLQATEVGKAVKGLRRHRSKQISALAQNLVDDWKNMVHEWINSGALLSETTPESADPGSLETCEGLPFLPLDEGAFLATQGTSMELSELFDGMDEDGNPRNAVEFEEIDGNERTPGSYQAHDFKNQKPQRYPSDLSDDDDAIEKQGVFRNVDKVTNKESQYQENLYARKNEASRRMMETKDSLQKQAKAISGVSESYRGGIPKPCSTGKSIGDPKLQGQPRSLVQKKPTAASLNKHSEEKSTQAMLETTKRKLHEGYQQAQNAKKQRSIQVMELTDLPKQPVIHNPQHFKSGNHTRKWAKSRH